MCKSLVLFMIASVTIYSCAMEDTIDYQKVSRPWVQNASSIYVYTKNNALVAEVPITQGATAHDIRHYLWKEELITEDTYIRFALSPILKDWVFFGYFDKKSTTQIAGNIKNHMNKHNTHSFWLNLKPRKVRDTSDSE